MKNFRNNTWLRKARGQGMTEYLIITALIAVAAIAVFAYFGKTIRNQVGGLSQEVAGKSAKTAISNAQSSASTAVSKANQNKGLGSYNNSSVDN